MANNTPPSRRVTTRKGAIIAATVASLLTVIPFTIAAHVIEPYFMKHTSWTVQIGDGFIAGFVYWLYIMGRINKTEAYRVHRDHKGKRL